MSKTVSKNNRTFEVPTGRETDKKRMLLQTINIAIQQLHHGDHRDFIEEDDYEDLAEVDEILRQVRERTRKRKSQADEEWQNEVIDGYLKEHNLPARTP